MSLFAAIVPIALLAATSATSQGADEQYHARQVYLCVEEVGILLIDLDRVKEDPKATVWTWSADDSPQIAPEHRRWFRGYDECKPVMGGSAVLVSSSWDGAIALIRRADKRCLFYAPGPGAHSAELIDDRIVAAVTSGRDGELRLYVLSDERVLHDEPAWSMKLPSGHGVVWDRRQQHLYALGGDELVKLRVTVEGGGDQARPAGQVVERFPLPASGGHDLSAYDAGRLVITVSEHVYVFDLERQTFEPAPGIGDLHHLKSVSRHPVTGQVMYTQARPGAAHTDRVEWVDGEAQMQPYRLIYKARWNMPTGADAPGRR